MREPRFRDTILYKLLKSGSYIGNQIVDTVKSYNTAGRKAYIEGSPNKDPILAQDSNFNIGAHRGADSSGAQLLGVLGDVSQLAKGTANRGTSAVRSIVQNTSSLAEDAGNRLGRVFGDMFGKINTSVSPYEDDDIVSLLNEKEEIEVLNRETERLRRIARIQARKREKIREMTTQALRSPYL